MRPTSHSPGSLSESPRPPLFAFPGLIGQPTTSGNLVEVDLFQRPAGRAAEAQAAAAERVTAGGFRGWARRMLEPRTRVCSGGVGDGPVQLLQYAVGWGEGEQGRGRREWGSGSREEGARG